MTTAQPSLPKEWKYGGIMTAYQHYVTFGYRRVGDDAITKVTFGFRPWNSRRARIQLVRWVGDHARNPVWSASWQAAEDWTSSGTPEEWAHCTFDQHWPWQWKRGELPTEFLPVVEHAKEAFQRWVIVGAVEGLQVQPEAIVVQAEGERNNHGAS